MKNSVEGLVLGDVLQVGTAHGPVTVAGGNTQIIASYNTYHNIYRGTWTDGVAPPPLADATGAMTESPYRGLATFGEQDAGFFFGRDETAGHVLDRMSQCLSRPGLLVVSGVSGAGKSSLLQAGVLPRIRRSGLNSAPEAASWPCLVLTPGREPLAGLASVAALAGIDAATTHQALKANPADFALTARQAAEFQPSGTRSSDRAGRGRRLLLIVDQFEQLFVQCPDEDQRMAFLTALHAAATEGHDAGEQPAALVMLVVRADFEARCAGYPLLADAVQDRYLVNAMAERQLRMIITEPAKKAGSRVDDDLVTVLLHDIRGRTPDMAALGPGLGMAAPAGILPLLSHVLDTAWRARAENSLTVTDYERAGGIERAVAASAERAYAGRSPAQQAAARAIFLRLTATSPDGTIAADRASRSELLRGKDAAQIRDVDAVLEAFARERLLTLAAGTVEISHEVLLRTWPLLRDQWLAGTQADRIVRTRLRAAAGDWDRSRRDPSYLYAGSLLQDAVATAKRADDIRQPELSQAEQEFLRASNRARSRTAAVRRGALAVLLSLTLGLAAAAAAAYQASQTAASQRNAAIASQLVAESKAQAATNPTASKIKSLAAWQIDATPQTRYALITAAILPNPAHLPILDRPVSSVAFSRDTTMLATSTKDSVVRLWNAVTQQEIGKILTESDMGTETPMAFSPDGRILATADGLAGGVQLWNVATQQRIGPGFVGPTKPLAMAFSPDGQTLAIGYHNGAAVRLWNVVTHRPIGHPLPDDDHDSSASSVAFSPDGRTLATAGIGDDGVRLWNVASQQQIGHALAVSNADTDIAEGVTSVAFSPNGQTLATGLYDHTVRLWNVASQQQIGHALTASTASYAIAIAFSPDGQTLATGSGDATVRLWNVATQQQIGQPFSLTDANYPGFYTVAFNPDSQTLAIGLQDGMVFPWNVASEDQIGLLLATTRTEAGDSSVAFSPDGQTLATGGNLDDTVRLWNVATQQQIGQNIKVGSLDVSSVAFSPDGQTLATSGDASATVQLWNVATQQQLGQTIAVRGLGVSSLAFSPDGQILATGAKGGTVRLWNVATQQQLGQTITVGTDIWDSSGGADAVAFSPDGRTLATTGERGTVQLWNVVTQKQIGQTITGTGAGYAVTFSPDGQTLATGNSGIVRLWNVVNQKQIGQPITDGTNLTAVDKVTFSPDGQTLATGENNGTVRLWNVATQQQIGLTNTSTGGGHAVTFRPDGRTYATANANGISQWDLNQIIDPLGQVCEQIGGQITSDQWRQYVPAGPAYNSVCP